MKKNQKKKFKISKKTALYAGGGVVVLTVAGFAVWGRKRGGSGSLAYNLQTANASAANSFASSASSRERIPPNSASLSKKDKKAIQRWLVERGHDTGGIDGIIGPKTRASLEKEGYLGKEKELLLRIKGADASSGGRKAEITNKLGAIAYLEAQGKNIKCKEGSFWCSMFNTSEAYFVSWAGAHQKSEPTFGAGGHVYWTHNGVQKAS